MANRVQEKMTAAQRTILAVVVATNLTTAFMGSSMNLSSPAIGDEFGVGATTLTWVVSAFTLTAAMLALPAGGMADTIGRRRVFLCGLTTFVAMTALGGLAPNLGVLLAARVGQALGGSMIQAANIPIAISAFPPQRRGMVLGWTVSAVYVGLGLGPVLGGVVNQYLGWRLVFGLTAAASLVVLAMAYRRVPVDDKGAVHIVDLPGNVLIMAGIFCLVFGMSNLSTFAWWWALVAVGMVLTAAFVVREGRAEEPVIDIGMFRHNRVFVCSSLAALMNYSATFAISYTMSLYLQNVMGLPSSAAGLVLVCQPLVQAVVSPACGRLSDTVAPSKLASLGMGLSALGLLALSFVGVDSGLAAVVVPLVVVGLGFGFFSSPNNNAALSDVKPSEFARANAVIGTMRSLGMSLSLAAITVVFAGHLGDTLVTEADTAVLAEAIRSALRMCAAVCGVGIVFSAVRGKPGQHR